MTTQIHVPFPDTEELLTVEYEPNLDPDKAGFPLLKLPFPEKDTLGYPTIHLYFREMKATGYRRYCGFVQLIERTETRKGAVRRELSVDVTPDFAEARIPYFSYGYPASLFDAPCRNLRHCDRLKWTAYTYLVEMPTRMNDFAIRYLAGLSWGYTEDPGGVTEVQELVFLKKERFEEHRAFLKSWMRRTQEGEKL